MNDQLAGRVFVFGDNINTDLIISGKYLRSDDVSEFGRHVFEVLRGEGFYRQVPPGALILAGENFGCGSSREQAVHAVKEAGFRAVLAFSFARIFFRNMINLGLPALVLHDDAENRRAAAAAAEGDILKLDLQGGFAQAAGREALRFHPLTGLAHEIVECGGLLSYAKARSHCAG